MRRSATDKTLPKGGRESQRIEAYMRNSKRQKK